MCGRFSLHSPAQIIAELFQIQWDDLNFGPRYNIAPTQNSPVILCDSEGQRKAQYMRWGLIPSWAKDPKIGSRMINARYETAAQKPSFRKAWHKRRCVVPLNGFFEWKSMGKSKQPFYIHDPSTELLAMAGLWERWQGPEFEIQSFTVLTRPAEGKVMELHHRMPIFLPLNKLDLWLDTKNSLEGMWFDLPDLDFFPVSKLVNTVKNDDPACIEGDEGPEIAFTFS